MNSPEGTGAGLHAAAGDLLRQAGFDGARFDLAALSGGANNQVYRVEFQDGAESVVLKHYFSSPEDRRDRFHSEKSFYDFVQAAGLERQTPRALAWDRPRRLGLFSWITGRRPDPGEVTRALVDRALDFYFGLNARRDLMERLGMPDASEACFDLAQHVACVERRLARLSEIDGEAGVSLEARHFILRELQPAFATYLQAAESRKVMDAEALPVSRRCISPSDFGFHNVLVQTNGSAAFFDFEYAGWDDPAKFICDFLCQPEVPVPASLAAHCIDSLCRPIPGGSDRARVTFLLPLYRLKWCCILLNEFLPGEQRRRVFSKKYSPDAMEARKAAQLAKSRNLLETLKGGTLG